MTGDMERAVNPISTSELERRWKAVSAAMAEQDIDVLVMQGFNEYIGGYQDWLRHAGTGWRDVSARLYRGWQ